MTILSVIIGILVFMVLRALVSYFGKEPPKI